MKKNKCIDCKEKYSISEFYSNGRGGLRPRCKKCHIKRFKRDSPLERWKKYARDAKKRGIEFDLSEEEFASFSETSCFYCGNDIDKIRLDRIDNNLGYNILNVVSCCRLCNLFKYTLTEEVFLKHVEEIYLYQRKLNEKRNNLIKGRKQDGK